jgi:hypothetical protein
LKNLIARTVSAVWNSDLCNNVADSFRKDTTAFIFVPVVLFLLGALVFSSFTPADNSVYVEGTLLDTYTEDDQGIAVMQVSERNNAEIIYYLVHVPYEYLIRTGSADTKMRTYKFNRKDTPSEVVHWEFSHSVLN